MLREVKGLAQVTGGRDGSEMCPTSKLQFVQGHPDQSKKHYSLQ